MANHIYKLALGGIVALILLGGYMAFAGYNTDIYPLDLSRGHLEGIETSSDPQMILTHLNSIKTLLPAEGNPVWIFPTDSTNFARMQADLNGMIASVEKIATVPTDSSAYHTGMLDVKERAEILGDNIEDATPYMYVSQWNIVYSALWIAAIIGIFAILKRKKEQLKEVDELGV